MAKRLTDTEKWRDEWFLELDQSMKLFWIYLLDTCDHAGVWKVNFKMASFCIGHNLNRKEVFSALSGRVVEISDNNWQIVKFIEFQYGKKLNTRNNAHRGVIKLIEFHGLQTSPYVVDRQPQETNTFDSLGDKDKEQDKDKDMDKEQEQDNKRGIQGGKQKEPERFVELTGPKSDDFLSLWNTELVPLGCKHAPLTLSPNAAMDYFKIKKLLEKNSMSVADYVEKIKQCDFLLRKKKGGLNITFALNEDNCFKIISGAYEEPEMSDDEAVAKFHSLLTGGM